MAKLPQQLCEAAQCAGHDRRTSGCVLHLAASMTPRPCKLECAAAALSHIARSSHATSSQSTTHGFGTLCAPAAARHASKLWRRKHLPRYLLYYTNKVGPGSVSGFWPFLAFLDVLSSTVALILRGVERGLRSGA